MEYIYFVVENGQAYRNAFKTYESAVKAVNDKHMEELERQIEEVPDLKEEILRDVNRSEDPSGSTFLYVEKGINIYIHRLPVV